MRVFSFTVLILVLLVHDAQAFISGCTDPLATNYNAAATVNDGSCLYSNSSVSPSSSYNLAASLSETSGLIKWNSELWTHNDNSDINLYALDSSNGSILQTYPLTGSVNNDWEEISQDSSYVYVGDFGNNVNGNRTDLKILRIEKNSLLAQSPVVDTISYAYSDQIDFTATGSNNTDFDCEAMIVSDDSIYLFTKQWVSNKTSLYALPKVPGNFIAELMTTFDVQGLVTGAVLLQQQRIVALCGYSNLLQPFTELLYDFTGTVFFSGNKRKVSISLPFHQVEGIATTDGLTFYMTNEYFSIVATPQKFHIFDFTAYLGNYINSLTLGIQHPADENDLVLFQDPVTDALTIKSKIFPVNYCLLNPPGQIVKRGEVGATNALISLGDLSPGIYFLLTGNRNNQAIKIIKK